MLRTGCMNVPADPARRERRISIMSRHTRTDGKTPDPEITRESYDEWWKELAPDEKALGAYLRKEVSFETFEAAYVAKLFYDAAANAAMHRLIRLALEEDVVFSASRNPRNSAIGEFWRGYARGLREIWWWKSSEREKKEGNDR
ncbi:MAG: 2-phosphosulfolactate phosphatase [Candidatus Moranbacteria bacterium]|nr:2-phosphosulfolactate phosphatase [Candidatus Moranbacteria bacterium]